MDNNSDVIVLMLPGLTYFTLGYIQYNHHNTEYIMLFSSNGITLKADYYIEIIQDIFPEIHK